MWYLMEKSQDKYWLSDRLIRAIGRPGWKLFDSDEKIDSLIESGADVNRRHGTLLPLHYASWVGDAHVLKHLILRGARVNEQDGYQRTALHYAAEQNAECVQVLLQNGANINQGDGNLDKALHWASYKNNVTSVKVLLQAGADVNAVDLNMDTPISWAARKGNLEVVKLLLDYNADVDIPNVAGKTALQRSAWIQASGLNTVQDDRTIKLLIKASGQFNLLDTKGEPLPRIYIRLGHFLNPLVYNPRSLLAQCRRQIRRCMGQSYLPSTIPHLPLPAQLQEFLLLQNKNEVVFGEWYAEDEDLAKCSS